MPLPRHLVVLARTPRLGTVKTRLARDIGTVAATRFYERSLGALLAEVAGGPWHLWLGVTPDRDRIGVDRLLDLRRGWRRDGRLRVFPQGDQGRGPAIARRMARPFAHLPPGPVVLVGSDIPDLRRHHIEAAFDALGSHNAVFGPAADGGYWLVGARRRPSLPDLFCPNKRDRVRWSTEHALADTIANLGSRHSHTLVTTLHDVDDGDAWRAWRARTGGPVGAAPTSVNR